MNRITLPAALLLTVLVMAATTASALACPIPFRSIGPITVAPGALTRPVNAGSSAAAWGLNASWTGVRPELNQTVLTKAGRRYVQQAYAAQRTLTIDAAAPLDRGLRYVDDDDAETQHCAIYGQPEWQPPVIKVKQSRASVVIAAAVQRTQGDRTGCQLGEDDAEWACPTLTQTLVRLQQPLGKRRLVFELIG